MRPELDFSFSAALRELAAVHRRDQARLLRGACALACARTALGRLFVAGFEHALSIWGRDCAEEIETARTDGFDVDPWLPRLLDQPPTHWPHATTLALAALELMPSQGARIDLARARIAEGETPIAIRELRQLLDEDPAPHLRGTALEALALAHECAGEPRASLACYEAAARQSRSDPRVTIALLALALREGDRFGVSLASRRLARLDLSVAGTRRRFDRSLRAARGRASRAERRGAELKWGILEMALTGPGACSEVARALI